MSLVDTKRSTPIANPRGIGDFSGSGTFDTIAVNYIKSKNRGAVTIENVVLNGSISGDVLGAPGGLATLDPTTGVIPPAQLGGALLTGITNGLTTALGIGSLTALAGGTGNTAVGVNSGHALTTGQNNVFVGDAAGALQNGGFSVFVGKSAAPLATAANGCVIIGAFAGANITSSLASTLIGANAGVSMTTQNENTFIGSNCGLGVTAGQLVMIGNQSGQSHTTGLRCTYVGYNTGTFNGANNDNTYLGYQCGTGNSGGSRCTFVGASAGVGAFGSDMTGVGNGVFAFGPALCDRSTAVGVGAMGSSNIGNDCAFVGYNAGHGAWGSFNVGVGSGVMANNQFGTGCTAVGYAALNQSAAVSSAVPGNTAFGNNCLPTITTGTGNLGLGISAGNNLGGTSSDCIFIGRNSNANGGTHTSALCITTRGTALPPIWGGTTGSLLIDTTGAAFTPPVLTGGPCTVIRGPGIGIYASPLSGTNIQDFTGSLTVTGGLLVTQEVLFGRPSVPGQQISAMGPISNDAGTSGLNHQWRIISGTVDAGGNPFGPNTGYTATRTGTGQFTVNFNSNFVALFAAHATIFGSSAATSIVIPTLTGGSATFQIRDSTSAAIDQAFFFTIIGQ